VDNKNYDSFIKIIVKVQYNMPREGTAIALPIYSHCTRGRWV